MKDDYVLFAVSKNEDKVFIVKNVTKNIYNELLTKQEKGVSEQIAKEKGFLDWSNNVGQRLERLENKDLLLAKSIYDNFVDRGLIENDDQFQQDYFDFIFNDKELDFDKAPIEYKKILEKVGSKNEKI